MPSPNCLIVNFSEPSHDVKLLFKYSTFSAAGENFENYGKLEARFLPFSAPQAKIFRNLEGQEARFSLLMVKSSMEKVGFRVGFSKFSSGRVSGRKKVRVSGFGYRVSGNPRHPCYIP